MAKTKEELNELKQECETLTNKLKELTDEELKQVAGGKELPAIDEDAEENRDAMSIICLLKENLDMWNNEGNDEK